MKKLVVYSPYDQTEIATLPQMNEAEVDAAIGRAHELFHDKNRQLSKAERIEFMVKLKAVMESRKEELCQTAAQEGGKPWMDSMVEVDRAINGVQLAIEHLSHMKGTEIPMGQTASSGNRMAYTLLEPIGVVSGISAFNHPLNLIVHQVIPAFAVGAPVLIKPASTTPLSCLKFKSMMDEVGIPEDWCQVILTEQKIAEKLVTDSRIAFLTFIGSGKVGWYLRSKLNPGANCALEHGGVAPVIVCKDASHIEIIPPLLKGGFYHAGQVCVSVQRIFAPEDTAEELAVKLGKGASELVVGDPLKPETEVGPLIKPAEVDRVENWVNEAVELGAKLICGGKRISDTCYEPTVLYDPPKDAKVSRLEVFGPVVCVYPYQRFTRAIEDANALPFSFQASIFTKNIDHMLYGVKNLKAKAVMVNDHTAFRVDWMPFGGAETSGIGTGGIPHSMDDMTSKKLMVIKNDNL
jgi:acyl-CoA reductase-like NAD-dependent aldehyde dehydrogenase